VFLWVTVMVLRILYTMTYDTVWYNIELKYPTVNQYMPYVTLSPYVSHVLVYRQTVNQYMPYVTLSPYVSHVLVYRQTVNQCMPYVTLSPYFSHVLVYRQTQHN